MKTIGNIMVAVDFSDYSRPAVQYAVNLANDVGATMLLVNVFNRRDVTMMEKVAALPWGFAVGGDVSPDGRRVIIRSPFNASIWIRPDGEPLWKAFQGKSVGIPLMAEPQGEAICFDSKGQGYFTVSEKAHPTLYYFPTIARGSD